MFVLDSRDPNTTPLSLAVNIVLRDGRVAIRSGGGWFNALFFFAIFSMFTAFALGPGREQLAAAAPALLWLGSALALNLAGIELFANDMKDGSLRVISAENSSLGGYIAGKFTSLFLMAAAPIALVAPIFLVVFGIEPALAFKGAAVFIAGLPALCLGAGVAAALTAGMGANGLLGACLSAPATIPVLIFGVGAIQNVVQLGSGIDGSEFLILIALDLIYLVILPPFAIIALRYGLE